MLKIKNKKAIYTILILAFICFGFFTGKATIQALAADSQYIEENKLSMLSVKCQVKERDGVTDLRMVSTIDQLEGYKTGGFEVYINPTDNDSDNKYGATRHYDYERSYACAKIDAKVGGVEFDYTPKVFDVNSNYFMTVTLTGIPESYYNQGILIKPFVTYDGTTRVYGTSRYIIVNDGLNGNVVSIPVKSALLSGIDTNTLTTSLTGSVNTFVDDEYTHVRVTMDSAVSTLASVTNVSISDSNSATPVEVSYRNLYSTAVTADTTWYNANNKKFVLVTAADLLGFAQVSKTDNFLEKTVYLGADITLNEGWTASATAPTTKWTPIGLNGTTINAFAGRFDGQGCTISGLYQSGTSGSKGMFIASKAGSTITDFSLVNSYFANTNVADSAGRVGGIVTYGAGTIDTIYCDAILKNNRKVSGGIVADANTTYGDLVIKNCQFAGTIMTDSTTGKDYTIGGIIGWARNNETTITDCLFTGTIDYGTNNTRIAGILARNGSGDVATQTTITNVLVDGTITGTSDTATNQYIGYVQGQQSVGTITVTAGTAYAEDNVYVNKNSEVTVSVTKTNVTTCSNEELTGANAESKAEGLFGTESVWTSQVMGHPVLKSFHWYNPDKTVYVINNVAELYEFAKISKTTNFRHKIVYLGADITVNEGTSEEIKANAASALQWTPIGTSTSNGYPFAGTFDGQGYTISGLCANAVTGEKALFQGTASTSVVKNLKLVNSYFATGFASGVTTSGNRRVGGIAVFGGGTFDSIYCDVLLENYNKMTGGIIADVHNSYGGAIIKNCQFAGDIDVTNCTSELSTGGLVGYIRANTTIEDCLMTGTITYGTSRKDADMSVGGVVGEVGTGSLEPTVTVTDVVNVGTIAGSGGKYIGSYIGNINNGSVATTDVYIKNRIAVDEIGRNASGTVTGEIHVEPKENLVAQKANGLDFDSIWSSLYNSTPILREFRDSYDGTTFTNTSYYETKNAIASTPHTFEAWIKVDANLSDDIRPGVIAGNYKDNSTQSFSFELHKKGQPALWWYDGTNTGSKTFSDIDLRTGEWTHLAMIVDETKGTVSCYVNGELKQTIEKSCGTITDLRAFRMGVDYRSNNSGLSPEYVELASVAIFSDMRSVDEIQADMSNINTEDTSLLGLYDISDKEPDALKDLSSYENHLTSTSGIEGMSFATDKLFMMNETLSEVPRTFEAYVFLPTGTGTGQSMILGNYEGDGIPYIRFDLLNAKPRIAMRIGDGEAFGDTFDEAVLSANKWTHVAVTLDDEIWTCYIDGVAKATYIPTEGQVVDSSMCMNPMCFGGDTTSTSKYFKGTIAKVAAYSDVRTPEEIVADMNSYGTDDLLVEYNTTYLPEDTTVVQDQTSNNYDAMLNGWINPEEYDGVSDYAYSFAVIGDTQRVNSEYPDKFVGIYDWIIANAESKKMKMVLGLGDITQNNTEAEWVRAQTNIQRLDAANIPYTVIRGNEGHDEIAEFNQYFSYDAYKSQLEGFYAEGDMTNAWRKIEINGIKYLIMMLDFGPSNAVLEWAGRVIEANPDYNVIITTHAYLYHDGTTLDENDDNPPSMDRYGNKENNGDDIWEKLVKKHKNIVLVLSGHDPWYDVVTTQTVGEKGNVVTQMLINPQNMDFNTGPAAMVAMLYFSADGKTVQVEYYSTARDQYWKASNQFTVTLDVVE